MVGELCLKLVYAECDQRSFRLNDQLGVRGIEMKEREREEQSEMEGKKD